MGNSIQEESGIPCVCNDFTGEVLRGIRMHATRFMKDLEESDMNKVSSASQKDVPASSMPQRLLWLEKHVCGCAKTTRLFMSFYCAFCGMEAGFVYLFRCFTIGWHSIRCLDCTAVLRRAML